MTSVVSGILFIPNLFGINPTLSRTFGIVTIVVSLLIACFMTYHELFIANKDLRNSSGDNTILTNPITGHLMSYHSVTLWEVAQQMEAVHGHADSDGLESDFRRGVLASDLMKHTCTRCGKPRNQVGDASIGWK